MNAYARVMSNYATFSGRASCGEFWTYSFIFFAMMIVVLIIDEMIFGLSAEGMNPLAGLFMLVHLLPNLAVTVRRLHDTDRSGWWFLFAFTGIGAIVVLIMTLVRGTEGSNSYGPDPKAVGTPSYAAIRGDTGASFDFDQQSGPQRREPLGGALTASGGAPTADLIGDLERLAQLKANGGLTDAEYEVMKAKTLSRASNGLW